MPAGGFILAGMLIGCSSGAASGPSSAATPPSTSAAPVSGGIELTGFDRQGVALDHDRFVEIETNGHGPGYVTDALVDPVTLEIIEIAPIYSGAEGQIVLERPSRPASLSFAWPSAQGYSMVVLDLAAIDAAPLNLLIARQAVGDLTPDDAADDAADAPSEAWQSSYAESRAALDRAEGELASDPAEAARLADEAWDQAVATALMRRTDVPAPESFRVGLTVDGVETDPEVWASMVALAGDREPWARIVFDAAEPPASYRTLVDDAHAAGVKVLGQFLDSSQMAQVSLAEFEARVQDYVAEFGDIESWEVGNEINGDWLGPEAAEKAAYAAAYVKEQTTATTMLTLYWQLGEGRAEQSVFTWAATHLTPEVLADLDDISLSMWIEEHPMGAAFDRVYATLAARFPDQQLLVGELGYGNDDLEHLWWWGDPVDTEGAGRLAVARDYLAKAEDRTDVAGWYWWYFVADAFPPNELWDVLAAP